MHVDCADVAAANEPGSPPVCAEAAAAIVSAASAMALHGQLLGARPAEARAAARTMYLSDARDPRPRVTRLPPRPAAQRRGVRLLDLPAADGRDGVAAPSRSAGDFRGVPPCAASAPPRTPAPSPAAELAGKPFTARRDASIDARTCTAAARPRRERRRAAARRMQCSPSDPACLPACLSGCLGRGPCLCRLVAHARALNILRAPAA